MDLPLWVEDGEGVRTEYFWDTGNGNLLSVVENSTEAGNTRLTSFTYDTVHPEDLTSVTDPEGKVWSYGYDPSTGYRVSETDPTGNETTYGFNAAGWLTSATSPKGNAPGASASEHTTTFVHDSAGRTVAVTDSEGGTTERFYGPSGLLAWEEDAEGNRTGYEYDDALQLRSVQRADSTSVGFEYWADGSLKTRVDGAGAPTGYTYDAAGRLATSTDPLGRTTTYEYDAAGRRLWVQAHGGDCTAAPTVRCTAFSYNDEGEVEAITHSDDNGIVTPDVTGITYDANGRRVAMNDGSGTSSWEWNAFGELVSSTAGNGDVVTYTYDKRGLQTTVTYPGSKTVTRSFDDAGRFVGLADWLGGTGNFDYDENSNLTEITYPVASGNVDTFTFDKADRLSGITYAKHATTLGGIDYGTRDANGRIVTADATGLPGVDETYAYDPLDQLAQVNSAVLDYDAADNLIVRGDGATQGFDAGNQLCFASPSGAAGTCASPPPDATTFGYDQSGNRVTETDSASGITTELGYDSANRLVSAQVPAGEGAQGQYHPVAPVRVQDTRSGAVPSAGSRDVTIVGVGGVPAADADAVVINLVAVSPSGGGGGFLTAFPADEPRPNASNVNFLGGQTIANAATVKLSADGKIKIYSSVATHYVIDVQGWYAQPDAEAGSVFQPLASASRVIDTRTTTKINSANSREFAIAGQGGVPPTGVTAVVANLTVVDPDSPGAVRVYPADQPLPNVSNLNHVKDDVLSVMVVAKLSPDGKTRIYAGATTHVILDVQGYFTTAEPEAGGAFHPLTPSRLFDTRPGADAAPCTPVAPTAACDRLAQGEAITLDLNGVSGLPAADIDAVVVNVTAVGTTATNAGYLRVYPSDVSPPTAAALNFQNGETLSNLVTTRVSPTGKITIRADFGAADVLVDVQGWYSKTTRTWTYAYDGDGYRTTKTAPHGESTGFTWDRSQPIPKLLTQQVGTGERTYLIYGPGGHPYAQITGTEITYYHRDHIGSTRLLTNETGDPVGTYTYDPYGALTDSTGTVTPLLGFAGEYTDTETRYTYLRARYYDPTTGQFLTRDPLEHTTGDPYNYAANNPTSYNDPTGLCPACWIVVPIVIEVALSAWDAYDAYGTFNDPCASTLDKWLAAGTALAGVVLPGNYGWADNAARAGRRTPRVAGAADDVGLSSRGLVPAPGTRVRPAGVPDEWRVVPTRSAGGTRYYDPSNPGNSVRVMQGNPNSPFPNSQGPYVRWQLNGHALDVNGNPLPSANVPEAHIPLSDFRFLPGVFG